MGFKKNALKTVVLNHFPFPFISSTVFAKYLPLCQVYQSGIPSLPLCMYGAHTYYSVNTPSN